MYAPGKSHARNEEIMSQIRCVFAWLSQVSANFRCPSHSHGSVEIAFSDRTAGVLHQGGFKYIYGDRSVIIYKPGAEHWVENKKAGEHICIGVVGSPADFLVAGVLDATPAILSRFAEIRTVLLGKDRLRESRLDFLSGLLVCDVLAANPNLPLPRTRAQQAREIIETSLNAPPSLKDLARRVSVSKEYLRELFRAEFGESITSYIIRRRIEHAVQLLRTTDDPIKKIASQTGFSSEHYFSRLFRKIMGLPPSQWRIEDAAGSRSKIRVIRQ